MRNATRTGMARILTGRVLAGFVLAAALGSPAGAYEFTGAFPGGDCRAMATESTAQSKAQDTTSLTVTVQNQTDQTLTLVSQGCCPKLPSTIAPNSSVNASHGSGWDNITNDVVYQIDSTHQVSLYWLVQMAGENQYSCSVTPDDTGRGEGGADGSVEPVE